MTYNLYTSNHLSTFTPVLSKIVLSQSIFSSCLVICQNKQLANILKRELADVDGISGNIDFIDQNKARQIITSLYLRTQAKFKNDSVPDLIIFKLLILKFLKEELFEDSLLENYFKDITDNQILSMKRLSLASEVSRLFDSYNKTNQKMIHFWNNKELISKKNSNDYKHECWQQKLMFKIFNNNNLIPYSTIFKEIIQSQEQPVERKTICIIGSAFLLENNLDFLHFISRHHDIHHFSWTPCQTYFGDINKKQNHQYGLDNKINFLLNNFGKLGRDLQNKLLDLENIDETEFFHANNKNSLLSKIQDQILEGINSYNICKEIDNKDINIEIINAPSKQREVEILYDNILDILNNSTDISPQDILILANDMNEYESLIRTVFLRKINSTKGENLLKLPLTFLDLVAMNHSSMIKGIVNILDIMQSNFSVVSILTLFQNPCFISKFRLINKDIDLFAKMIKDLNITSFFSENAKVTATNDDSQKHWHIIFKRILLGFIMNDEQEVGDTLPYNGIPLSSSETIFKLIEICSSLLKDLKYFMLLEVDIKTWSLHFRKIILKYLSPRHEFVERDEKFREKILSILEYFSENISKVSGLENLKIDFQSFYHILTEKISTLTTSVHVNRKNGISFGSIRNNRLLPAKVVCFLGMNESVFPSHASSFNFDLRKLDPNILDAEITDVDKYCFLEIITTTKEKLLLSYVGRDEITNTDINPSIVVEELIEYIDSHFKVRGGSDIKELLIKKHPLDGFDGRYFDKTNSLFSYNSLNFRTWNLNYEKHSSPLFSKELNLAKSFIDDNFIHVSILELKQFLKNPVKFFIQNKLNIYLDVKEPPFTNSEQFFSLSFLKQYQFFKYILNNIVSMNKKTLFQEVDRFIRYLIKDGSLVEGVIADYQKKYFLQEVDTLKDTFLGFSLSGRKQCFLAPQAPTKASFFSCYSNTENIKKSSLLLGIKEGISCEISGETEPYYSDCFVDFVLKDIKPKHFVSNMVDYLVLSAKGLISDKEVKSLVYIVNKKKVRKKTFNLSQEESLQKLTFIITQMVKGLKEIYSADIDYCHTVMKTKNPDAIPSKLFEGIEKKARYCPYTKEFLKVTHYLNQDIIADFARNVYNGLII